jgi:protein SCO1/2
VSAVEPLAACHGSRRVHPAERSTSIAPAQRRAVLRGAAALTAAVMVKSAEAHARYARPRPMPAVRVLSAQGRATTLREMLAGRVTLLHLLVTTCSATCPIQGEILSAFVQKVLQPDRQMRDSVRIVSLSIDPLGDRPADVLRWIRERSGSDAWAGAIPTVQDIDVCASFFASSVGASARQKDDHLSSVFVFDREARLAIETAPLPSLGELAGAVRELG